MSSYKIVFLRQYFGSNSECFSERFMFKVFFCFTHLIVFGIKATTTIMMLMKLIGGKVKCSDIQAFFSLRERRNIAMCCPGEQNECPFIAE